MSFILSKALKETQARRKTLEKLNERVKAAAFSKKYENFDEIIPAENVLTVLNTAEEDIRAYATMKQQIAVANTTVKLENGMTILEGMTYVGYAKQIIDALKELRNASEAEMVNESYGRTLYLRKAQYDRTAIEAQLTKWQSNYNEISIMIDKANITPQG